MGCGGARARGLGELARDEVAVTLPGGARPTEEERGRAEVEVGSEFLRAGVDGREAGRSTVEFKLVES